MDTVTIPESLIVAITPSDFTEGDVFCQACTRFRLYGQDEEWGGQIEGNPEWEVCMDCYTQLSVWVWLEGRGNDWGAHISRLREMHATRFGI